jgi:hypothetical protein
MKFFAAAKGDYEGKAFALSRPEQQLHLAVIRGTSLSQRNDRREKVGACLVVRLEIKNLKRRSRSLHALKVVWCPEYGYIVTH